MKRWGEMKKVWKEINEKMERMKKVWKEEEWSSVHRYPTNKS